MYRKNKYVGLVGNKFLNGISIEIYNSGEDMYRLVAAREDGQAIEKPDKKGYAEACISKDDFKKLIQNENKDTEIRNAMNYVGL